MKQKAIFKGLSSLLYRPTGVNSGPTQMDKVIGLLYAEKPHMHNIN